jgi:hypothetical protein
MKAYWGSEGMTPLVINLGTTWRCAVHFSPAVFPPPPHLAGGWVRSPDPAPAGEGGGGAQAGGG